MNPKPDEAFERMSDRSIAGFDRRGDTAFISCSPLPMCEHDAAGRFDPFPLTDMQQAYWIGRKAGFELGNMGIHSYLEFETELIDELRFERAWNCICNRHDMLRAIVHENGTQQVLAQTVHYKINVVDITSLDYRDRLEYLHRVRYRLSHQLFSPNQWPAFELCITHMDATSVIHVSLDGLFVDAWSLNILFDECWLAYSRSQTCLPELPITFRDYVMASRSMRDTDEFRRSLDWWRSRIDEIPGPPALPIVRRPGSMQRRRFSRKSGRISDDQWQQIRSIISSLRLTAPCVLITAFAEVLAGWSSESRFTLNIPRFDRMPLHSQVDNLVGEFASFTLVVYDHSCANDLLGRAQAVQAQMWAVLARGLISGGDVLRLISCARGRGAAAFPVVFTANPTLGRLRRRATIGGWVGKVSNSITQTPQVWLDFQAGEDSGALTFNVDSVDGMFPGDFIDSLIDELQKRLIGLIGSQPVGNSACS